MLRLVFVVLLLASLALTGCGASAPAAGFAASPTTGGVPLEIQFTDESGGEIDAWEWDFDDDGVVDSTEKNPRHTYTVPGQYSVSLEVTGPGGSDTETKAALIELAATPTPTPEPCKADFVADPTVGEGVTMVQFTDLSTGPIDGWEWDFDGDGETDSTEQHPQCRYAKNGDYSVTLAVTGAGCEDSRTKADYIRISGCPT
jgi:PKD repeat protein